MDFAALWICRQRRRGRKLGCSKARVQLVRIHNKKKDEKIQLICHVAFVLFKKAFEIFNTELGKKEVATTEETNTTGDPVNFFYVIHHNTANKIYSKSGIFRVCVSLYLREL